jgi:hypothetical protein
MNDSSLLIAGLCCAVLGCSGDDVTPCPSDSRSTVVVCDLLLPRYIVAADTALFVMADDAIVTVDLENGSLETTANLSFGNLGVFGGRVYWWGRGGLSSVSPDEDLTDRRVVQTGGGTGLLRSFVAGFPRPSWVSTETGEIFLLSEDASSTSAIVTRLMNPTEAVVGGQALVVVESSTVPATSRLLQFPLAGGLAIEAAQVAGQVTSLVGRPEGTYFASAVCEGRDCESWISVLRDGVGNLDTLVARIRGRVAGLLVTDTHMYWSQGNAVRRCDKQAQDCVTMLDGLKTAADLAIQDGFLYMVDRGLVGDMASRVGRVHKVPAL